jgi:acetate kinase
VRAQVCDGLSWLGVSLDSARNERMVGGVEGRISTDDSRVEVWVIPTDEELLIARDTVRVITGVETRY